MKMWRWLAASLFALGVSLSAAENVPKGYKLFYEETFEKPESIQQFQFTDPNAWKYGKEEKGGSLELAAQSKYAPAVRSPFNIALLKEKVFGDFVLEADLVQTGKEYGHRDMCLFFGVQDPSHFYYAHMATKADPHAHNIFIVNDAPRTNIAKTTTGGVNWGLNVWHKVRLERKVSDGTVKVYFDDMTLPIMTAQDKTFGAGFVGFGSFDDTGKVDNIKIWGADLGPSKSAVDFKSPPKEAK
jgi:hypothetical protein